MPRKLYAKLAKVLGKRFSEKDLEMVRHAYRFAAAAHQGQVRLSGEPYVMHTLNVGLILAGIGLDPVTVSAGVLHDVLEDTAVTRDELKAEFGPEIVRLVDGVTKIRHISIPDKETIALKEAQNIRKLLVATAKDVRVILIKLADRLHNLRTIDPLPEPRRRRIARETLDIYTPVADRLGISTWKWELEDLSFRQLKPEAFHEIARLVDMKRRLREQRLRTLCSTLEAQLRAEGVEARVIGRAKHFYSIHRKMASQGKDFDEVMDVEALRIITPNEGGCYAALGIVHKLWPPVPGRFKDYISIPKYNMYQSIHTTVMRENGRPMEIQIRSEDMDRTARHGIAAHWVYKEGGRDQKLDEQLSWLRTLFEWMQDATSTEEIMETVARDFTPSNVYVFTPKGAVKELPLGATPLDFAYAVHSDVGNHCIGARVNNRLVPLRYHLQNGDVVEILTARHQNPARDWLDVVVTGKARTRIRQRLREIGTLEPAEPEKKTAEAPPPPPKPVLPVVSEVDTATRLKLIRIDGGRGLAAQFAKCCNPMPGHAVVAYITLNPAGVTVHRKDCPAFNKSPRDAARVVPAYWEGEGVVRCALRVVLGQRPNVLPDLMDKLRPMNISILEARFSLEPGNGKCRFDFLCELPEDSAAERLKRALREVPGVSAISPLRPAQFGKPPAET